MGIFQKHGKYYIDFYADGRRVRECVGEVARRIAENALSARRGEVVQGKYQLRSKAPSQRFDAFAQRFLEYSKVHKSSRTTEADQTRMKHLLPFFGRYALDQITPFHMEKYIHDRRQETTRRKQAPAPATINRELSVLKHVFNKAIEWGAVAKNPAGRIKMLKEPPPTERVLSEEEEKKLFDASCPHLRMAILIALHTGLRLKEVLTLRWKNIDMASDIVTVIGKGGKLGKVEINSRLKKALTDFHRQSDSEYLFPSDRTGKPILSPKTAFHNAVRRAGIGHIRFHDLRHTFATRLLMRGADIVTVQKLMRHSTILMTMRYSHPGAIERRRAVSLLSDGHHVDTAQQNVVEFNSVSSSKINNMGG